jgi:hypothetical protein
MCFNGAKSWWLGWYSETGKEGHEEVSPAVNSWEGKLVGIDDYITNNGFDDSNHRVILKVKTESTSSAFPDLYVMFNRKKGVNAEVAGFGDTVTVVSQFKEAAAQSWLIATLDATTDTFWNADFDGSGSNLVVQVCEIVYGTPDYARVIVYLQGTNALSCTTPSPTVSSAPSLSPTPMPSSFPSGSPTVQASLSPTKAAEPSAYPSLAPTASPMPSAAPSSGPTSSPLAETSASPSSKPSATSSGEPTSSPTLQPSSVPTKSPMPSSTPTLEPSKLPTTNPSADPTAQPSPSPSTSPPTESPTPFPTLGCALAQPTESCFRNSDCCSGACSGGKKENRNCLY